MKVTAHKKNFGFTLVELLIVIAVIGVLAAVILAVINPLQQLARGRDAGRISTVAQLGSALQRFATANTDYPTVPALGNPSDFMTELVSANEIQTVFENSDYGGTITAGCTVGENLNQGNYCYNVDGNNNAIVYVRAESNANNDLCTGTDVAWIVWSSAVGRSGIECTTNVSTPPPLTGIDFEN